MGEVATIAFVTSTFRKIEARLRALKVGHLTQFGFGMCKGALTSSEARTGEGIPSLKPSRKRLWTYTSSSETLQNTRKPVQKMPGHLQRQVFFKAFRVFSVVIGQSTQATNPTPTWTKPKRLRKQPVFHVGIMDFKLQFLINALGMILSTIPASDSLALKSHELLQYPLNPRQIAIPKGPGNANIRASKRKK